MTLYGSKRGRELTPCRGGGQWLEVPVRCLAPAPATSPPRPAPSPAFVLLILPSVLAGVIIFFFFNAKVHAISLFECWTDCYCVGAGVGPVEPVVDPVHRQAVRCDHAGRPLHPPVRSVQPAAAQVDIFIWLFARRATIN